MTSAADLEAAAYRVSAELGDASIVVNNAGLHPRQTLIDDVDYDLWRRTMQVNTDSMFLVTSSFLPQLRASGIGRIINMSSSVVNVAPLGGVLTASSGKPAVNWSSTQP